MIDFDFTELGQLAVDVSKVPDLSMKRVGQAVEVTARKTKDAAKENIGRPKLMQHIAPTVDYDIDKGSAGATADIGFSRNRKQGRLGNFLEYGSRYFPARQPLAKALHDNEEDFVEGIARAVEDSLKEAF